MNEIFNQPTFADMFKPNPLGTIVKLSEEATRAIIENHRGKRTGGKLYILLTPEGDLDPNWPYVHEWAAAVRRVQEAILYAYNASTKRCSRPVWHHPAGLRTPENCTWESVRLIPVERELDKASSPAHSRFFK